MFPRQSRTIILALILLLVALTSGTATQLPVSAAPDDTPVTLVTENVPPVTDWIVEEGMLYWANQCPGGEFVGPGFLRRMPVGGGTNQTLATTDDESCATFAAMTAEPEGLYYYSYEEGEIQFRSSVAPYDPPTPIYETAESPARGSNFATNEDYLYWITEDILTGTEIHRVHKDGSGHQSLYAGAGLPSRMIMLYGMPVWTDVNGVWYLEACASPPCARHSLSGVPGSYITYYSTGLFTFDLYWTDIASTPDRILRANCNYFIGISPSPSGLSCGAPSPFYSAPDATWNIGQVRRAGTNLFWAERLAGAGPTDGRIRRQSLLGGTAQDILTNARLLDDELVLDNLYVYFATVANDPSGLGGGIYRLPLDASAIVRDLQADWFEVTQGIQNRGNTVELTADKTTYVRGYALQASGPNTPMVHAVLHGTRSGNPLPGSPLAAINGTHALSTGAGYDRGTLDAGWLFALPANWTTAGTTDFRLEVDSIHAYPDPNRANNSALQTLTFVAKAPVCTVFVPVRTNAPTPHTSDPNFAAFVDMARRLWPTEAYWSYRQDEDVAELEACWWGPFPYPCFGPYELPDDTWKVLLSLKTRDVFTDDPDECDDAGAVTHYVGMVHPSTNTDSTNGAGYMGQSAAWVKLPEHSPTSSDAFDFPRKGGTLAHELGHNADRLHVNCGGPADPDPSYPYPTNQIANVGQNSYYGFDVRTRTVLEPTDVADLMGYCQPRWPSDYTWRALFNWLDAGVSTASVDSSLATAAGAVYASGSVAAAGGSGTLNYAYVYPTAAMNQTMLAEWSGLMVHAASSDASYSVRVKDAGGNVIATSPVTLLVAPDAPGGSSQAFITVFPSPSVPGATLELLENTTVITSRIMGPAVPVVTVNQPTAGETVDTLLTVRWQATDPNSTDVLLYTIQYSPDNGLTWISLATDYADAPEVEHTFTLATPAIPATIGPNQGLIRVLASDGYNTGINQSPGFTVLNRKPEAFIVVPAPGDSFAAGEMVTVRGMAFDAEDGYLTGNALAWQLLGIPVGTGETVSSDGLAPGVYPLKLTASDTQTATDEATAQLVINTLGIAAGDTPTLDGYCTDASYTTAAELHLRAYGAGDQAVVRLLRTSNHLWACFSGLKPGALVPGSLVGLVIDPNHSGGAAAQADDYAFAVGENGAVSTSHGNGAGAFVPPGPGGLAAQVAMLDERWSVELRINKDVLGGWDKAVRLAAANLFVANANDNYLWPHISFVGVPDTWATTALGDLPTLDSLSPPIVVMMSSAFSLTVNGQNFTEDAVVLYNDAALTTTFVDANQVTVPVEASQLLEPGIVKIQVRASASSPLVSNPLSLTITARPTTISSLSPGQKNAGDPDFVLAVMGPGFHSTDIVYWNNVPLATTFASEGQLNAVVPASLVAQGGMAGITVYCAGPDGGAMSNTLMLTIQPQAPTQLNTYMPFTANE